MLMVNKTTGFKEGQGQEGKLHGGKLVAAPVKKPKNPNPRRSASIRGTVTGSGTASNTWYIRRLSTSTKVYLIYVCY